MKSIAASRTNELPPHGWPAFFTIFPTFAELLPLVSGFETVVTTPPSKSAQVVAVSKSNGNATATGAATVNVIVVFTSGDNGWWLLSLNSINTV